MKSQSIKSWLALMATLGSPCEQCSLKILNSNESTCRRNGRDHHHDGCPRLVGHPLGKLKIPGSQAVMIGDTPYDAEAGKRPEQRQRASLPAVSRKILQAGCVAVADNLPQLLLCLESGEPVTPRQTSIDNLIEFPSKRMAS